MRRVAGRLLPRLLGRLTPARRAESSAADRIVVVGGGFGGLYCALRLSQHRWQSLPPAVTLVDANASFVFKPLMFEMLSGDVPKDVVVLPYDELLSSTNTRFVHGTVDSVDLDAGEGGGVVVVTDSGSTRRRLRYDWLVVAAGATVDMSAVPGADALALRFSDASDAGMCDTALSSVLMRPPHSEAALLIGAVDVAVVGGGAAGVELAVACAVRLRRHRERRRVVLLCGGDDVLGPDASSGAKKTAMRALAAENVDVRFNARVTHLVEGPDGDKVVAVAGMESVRARSVLWAAGSRRGSALLHGDGSVDSSLRMKGREREFVIGDAAAADTTDAWAPATAQAAMQQGVYVADTLHDLIDLGGRPWRLTPFRYHHLGSMLSLGPGRAAVTVAGSQKDTVTLRGPLAAAVRRLVYVARMPTFHSRRRAAAAWLAAGPSVWLPPEGPAPLGQGGPSPFADNPAHAAASVLGAVAAAARGFGKGVRRTWRSAQSSTEADAAATPASTGPADESATKRRPEPPPPPRAHTHEAGLDVPGLRWLTSAPPSRRVERSASVRASTRDAWLVVANAFDYPGFVPWCSGAVAEGAVPDVVAYADTGKNGAYHCRVRFGFGSVLNAEEMLLRVSLDPCVSVDASLADQTANIAGLRFYWTFRDAPGGCDLQVRVDVQCTTQAHDSLFRWYEQKVVADMVDAFRARIESVAAAAEPPAAGVVHG